tara:strand:- start:262 stop:522 length:261 start_codon:yes stop_codon:yes gene_type:complete
MEVCLFLQNNLYPDLNSALGKVFTYQKITYVPYKTFVFLQEIWLIFIKIIILLPLLKLISHHQKNLNLFIVSLENEKYFLKQTYEK